MTARPLWLLPVFAILIIYMAMGPISSGPSLQKSTTDSKNSGTVLQVEGNVLVLEPAQPFYFEVKKGQTLGAEIKILTGSDSKVLLEIQEKFWLMPNSQIHVQAQTNNDNEKGLVVHLLGGSLERLSPKDSSFFYVSGKQSTGEKISRGPKIQIASSTATDVETLGKDSLNLSKVSGVNEKQIHKNIRLSQKFFEKCFIAHYTRKNGKTISGRSWVRFFIKKDGKLTKPNVFESAYKDTEYHKCLEEVFRRIRVKGYQGPETQMEFPMDITLPQ